MTTTPTPAWMRWTGWILSGLLGALLVLSGVMKVTRNPDVVKPFTEHLKYPESALVPIGVTEIACVVLFLIPQTGIFGAALLTAYMGGAVATHVRLGEPFYTQVAFGVVIWVAYCLRKPGVLRAALA